MLKQTLTYWVECDGNDCKSRCPHKDDEFASYNDKSFLEDETLPEQDWRTLPFQVGKKDQHFCDRCWDSCEPCRGDGWVYADEATKDCADCDGRGWNPAGGESGG